MKDWDKQDVTEIILWLLVVLAIAVATDLLTGVPINLFTGG